MRIIDVSRRPIRTLNTCPGRSPGRPFLGEVGGALGGGAQHELGQRAAADPADSALRHLVLQHDHEWVALGLGRPAVGEQQRVAVGVLGAQPGDEQETDLEVVLVDGDLERGAAVARRNLLRRHRRGVRGT
jgi:hypothetical protein